LQDQPEYTKPLKTFWAHDYELATWDALEAAFDESVMGLFNSFMEGKLYYTSGPFLDDIVEFLEKEE
jgi:hypothetical protein